MMRVSFCNCESFIGLREDPYPFPSPKSVNSYAWAFPLMLVKISLHRSCSSLKSLYRSDIVGTY